MATCCALFQLARWAVVLKNQSERANAVKVLEHFVRQAGSENSVVWHADWQSQGPCDPLKPVTLSAVPVTVRAGMAKVGPLLRAFPKLRAIVGKRPRGHPQTWHSSLYLRCSSVCYGQPALWLPGPLPAFARGLLSVLRLQSGSRVPRPTPSTCPAPRRGATSCGLSTKA